MNLDSILKKYKLSTDAVVDGVFPSPADACDLLFLSAWRTQQKHLHTLAEKIDDSIKTAGEVRTDSIYGALFRADYNDRVHTVSSSQLPKAESALNECLEMIRSEQAALVWEYEITEIRNGLFKKEYSCKLGFKYEKFSGFRETAFKLALAFAGRRPPDDERSAEYLRLCDSSDPRVAAELNSNPYTDTERSPEQLFEKGITILGNDDAGDSGRALRYISLSADAGFVPAQIKAGEMYELGIGIASDAEKALEYYRLAADSGDISARFRTGELFAKRGTADSLKEAFRYFRMAADGGDPQAQYRTALCLAEGKGTARNREEAVRYLRSSAAQGNEQALKRISMMDPAILKAHNGQDETAMDHLLHLADQGNPTAKTKVALAMIEGNGIVRDPEKGFSLLVEAADGGFREAQYRAGLCLKNGVGTERDFDRALMYFRKAADKGHSKAYIEAENLADEINRYNEGEKLCAEIDDLRSVGRFDEIIKIIADHGDILKNKAAVSNALKEYIKKCSGPIENIRRDCILPEQMDAAEYFYDIAVDLEKDKEIHCAVTAYVYAALEGSRKALSVLFAMAGEQGKYFIAVDEMLLT